MDIEEYNKIPNKCKLCLQLICRIRFSDNNKDLVEKHRIQRMECWDTNHCKWKKCLLEIPRNEFKKMKCHCGGNLHIVNEVISCSSCSETFKVISLDKRWLHKDEVQDDIGNSEGNEAKDMLVLQENHEA